MKPRARKPVSPALVEARIRTWLAEVVVGLNLCPFARPLPGADNLRIAVCDAADPASARREFLLELDLLQGSSEQEVATTLLAFPAAFAEFEAYLDFLDQAQTLVADAGLEGVVQLASFHPLYLFAGEPPGAASHYSNRSPYPVIHLLREDMLSRVLAEDSDPQEIPARNIATLEGIGVAALERRWEQLFGSSD
jgi:hypothetical protein